MNANLTYSPTLYDALCALPEDGTSEILSRHAINATPECLK